MTILDTILEAKRAEVEAARRERSLADLETAVRSAGPTRA
jgi:hypothetical protein